LTAARRQLEREERTIRLMVSLYCRGHRHSKSGICGECGELSGYLAERFALCPYRAGGKPACGLCRSNCFSGEMHRRFRAIMRYAGPRMLVRHPLLTLAHLLDALRGGRGDGQSFVR
jgi:hypothetical protein